MLNNKDYCDYDTCVALGESGFPLKRMKVKNFIDGKLTVDTTIIPVLLYEARNWLRETHNLHIEVTYTPACWTCRIYDLKKWEYIKGFTFICSFEEALSIGIKEAVNLIK